MDLLKTIFIAAAIVLAGYFISDTVKKARAFDRYVEVKGLAEREVQADLAVWPIEITLAGNDLQTLNRQLEGQKKETHDFFSTMGFNQEELSIGITNITDSRANYYGGNQGTNPYRYIAKSEITLRTTDIAKMKKALTESLTLISKGILISSKNQWRPIEYIYSGLNDIKPAMIEEATKKAKEVAEKFAQDSEAQVGKIKTARQGLFTITDRDQNTPEIKIVRVVTTVNYFLED
jgi:hypothetical protein